jgi:hypothetical protein
LRGKGGGRGAREVAVKLDAIPSVIRVTGRGDRLRGRPRPLGHLTDLFAHQRRAVTAFVRSALKP